MSSGEGRVWLTYRGTDYYAGYKNSGDVTILSLMPKSEIDAHVNGIRDRAIIYTAILAVLIISVIFIILRRALKPLAKVSEDLNHIAGGDLNVDLQYDGKDEIGELVRDMAVVVEVIREKIAAEKEAHELALAKGKAEAAHEALLSSIHYASKIQNNLRPDDASFGQAFTDYSIIWQPRDLVGGDIYWLKNFGQGSLLCVCDCTGHGTPGALLTMLVVSALDAVVTEANYTRPDEVLYQLDQRLATLLNVQNTAVKGEIIDITDGCDLALLYVAADGVVTIASAGTRVFVSDGEKVTLYKGQKLHVGDGKIDGAAAVQLQRVPAKPGLKYYVASDGLYDQIGGELKRPFGYRTFRQTILEHHGESHGAISARIWEQFEAYRGGNLRRDDVQLITFTP